MKRLLLFLMMIFGWHGTSQSYVLDSILPLYSKLIHLEHNSISGVDDSYNFATFFRKLDSLYEGKKEKIHIFHIGGSHIQADIYSHRLRRYLQNMNGGTTSQRGFIFPYHLAHTNNPVNYKIAANKEKWTGYRNSIKKDSVAWGLSGITAAFREVSDTISIHANLKNPANTPYTFDRIRIFHNTDKDDYELKILDTTLVLSDTLNILRQYREFHLSREIEEVELSIHLKDSLNDSPEFLLMGIELMNDKPGIEYTSIGVNGASFNSYQRSAFFENQLQLYAPDLFIISIGTNDAYVPKNDFDPEEFKENYRHLIEMILRINPDCAILLTVPNDNYYRRKIPNPNTARQQKVIFELAEEYRMAVWDFYSVMGGLGSSNKWYTNKLMPRDRIHFTNLGYQIKGDLLLKALVEAWAGCINREEEDLLNHFKAQD